MLRSLGLAGIAVLLVTAGSGAAATGYLVNVEAGNTGVKAGSNVFGGQGDTVDAGLFNSQCTDEDDVVDVGVANDEGNGEPFEGGAGADCPNDGTDGCRAEDGGGLKVVVFREEVLDSPDEFEQIEGFAYDVTGFLVTDSGGPGEPRCTDDGDSVDVGVANAEGNPDERKCDPASDFDRQQRGDADDGVDVGVLNQECFDGDDADDVGVLNCETTDDNDGIDVGVLNVESKDDAQDTLDLSVFNAENGDTPDRNGLNVGGSATGLHLCKSVDPCPERFPIHGCEEFIKDIREQTGIP